MSQLKSRCPPVDCRGDNRAKQIELCPLAKIANIVTLRKYLGRVEEHDVLPHPVTAGWPSRGDFAVCC